MRDVKQCVYKYVHKDSIIYIGKTDASLKQRINGHSKEDKFLEYLDDVKIYFIKLKNKAETSFMETYLINKYKPILNVVDVYDGDSGINLEEPMWIEFSKNKSDTTYIIHKKENENNNSLLDENILSNIKRYNLKAKFTIDELISYHREIQDILIEIHGCSISSSWFCVCNSQFKEQICFGDEAINDCFELRLHEFDNEDNEKSMVLTKNDLQKRYKNKLFFSYLALYDYTFNKGFQGWHPKFNETMIEAYKELSK